MKIYTKTGDDGTTSLFGGNRVPKHHIRVDAYGSIDELNSFIGLLIAKLSFPDVKNYLQNIQHILFNLGSLVATVDEKYIEKLPPLKNSDILSLENEMDKMEEKLPKMTQFILPGGSEEVALTHICRTICRRSERRLVALCDTNIQNLELGVKLLK